MILLPDKKYNTIVIDPPWDIPIAGRMDTHTKKDNLPYKTMSLKEIKDIPIGKIANTGCHIYCWTTNAMLRDTFDVLNAWGVNFHLCLVWTKNSGIAPCLGYVFATEFCLLGFFGKPMQKFSSVGKLNWLNLKQNSRGKHSSKPLEWYKLIEKMSPPPRIDIFARTQKLNWDVFGDEIDAQIPLNIEQLSEVKVADGTPTTNDGIPPNNKLSGILPTIL